MSGSALCSVAHFFRCFSKHNTRLQSGRWQFTFLLSASQGSLFSSPCPAFLVFTLYEDRWCEVIHLCSVDLQCPPVLLAEKGVCPFLEYIQKKTHTPFLANCIVGDVQSLFMCFNGESFLPLQIPFLQFSLAYKFFLVTYLKTFFDDRYFQLCSFVNFSAPEFHFLTCFFLELATKQRDFLKPYSVSVGNLSLWSIRLPDGKIRVSYACPNT